MLFVCVGQHGFVGSNNNHHAFTSRETRERRGRSNQADVAECLLMGPIRPWCPIGADGSLFPDGCCAEVISLTATLGQQETSTKQSVHVNERGFMRIRVECAIRVLTPI